MLTAYSMLVIIAGCLLLPGFLFVWAWGPRPLTHSHFLVGVLPAGVLVFAVLGVASAVVAGAGLSWSPAGLLTYVALLLPAGLKLRRDRRPLILQDDDLHTTLAYLAWLSFGLVIVLCFGLSYQGVKEPWDLHFHRDISLTKTFGTYPTHDNYFQFVNGAAIADGEPFSKYYGEGRLVYPVTSREMLPGLCYAGLRFLLRAAGRTVEQSFLCYLQFGLILNAGLVLGLAALIGSCRLGAPVFAMAVLAFWSSPYALMNTYFTWFKFAGAAFTLLAVATLLEDVPPTARRCALAGSLLGIAASMHGGNALAIPFLAWAVFRSQPFSVWRHRSAIGKVMLAVSCFLVLLAPWAIVKALWFPPDRILVRQHYFNHTGTDGESIWKAVHFLFTHWSVQQHLAHRVGNLVRALRLPEWIEILQASPRQALVFWMQFRITYVGFVLAPIGVLAALCVAGGRRSASHAISLLGRSSLFGILALLVAHFSTFYADMTASLPASLIVITHTWLVFLATEGRWRRAAIAVACFSVVEWAAVNVMITRGVGQTPFPQTRTVMPDTEMFSYRH